MLEDTERPARVRAEQERLVATCLRREVFAYSAFYSSLLETLPGLASRVAAGGLSALDLLPASRLEQITEPRSLVLAPSEALVLRRGYRSLAARLLVSRATGTARAFHESRLDPQYRPLVWASAGGFALAYTAVDLAQLAEVGRRWLEAAGLRVGELVAGAFGSPMELACLQLSLGARRAGTELVLAAPGDPALATMQPVVLVGGATELISLSRSLAALSSVRLVVVTGSAPLGPSEREGVEGALKERGLAGAELLECWAPPGVKALWAQCSGGSGVHTWPGTELVQADGGGRIVWTSLAWRGSVLLRLQTGVAARIDRAICPSCGRATPRIVPLQQDHR
ncbi:MAG: phenylacetate--CoA ligase family protein [Acidimicrobiales bacterium]